MRTHTHCGPLLASVDVVASFFMCVQHFARTLGCLAFWAVLSTVACLVYVSCVVGFCHETPPFVSGSGVHADDVLEFV
jgi:hypothetical protein